MLHGFFRKGRTLMNKSAHWTGREGSSDVCGFLSVASHLLGVASHLPSQRLQDCDHLLFAPAGWLLFSLSISSPQSQMELSPPWFLKAPKHSAALSDRFSRKLQDLKYKIGKKVALVIIACKVYQSSLPRMSLSCVYTSCPVSVFSQQIIFPIICTHSTARWQPPSSPSSLTPSLQGSKISRKDLKNLLIVLRKTTLWNGWI